MRILFIMIYAKGSQKRGETTIFSDLLREDFTVAQRLPECFLGFPGGTSGKEFICWCRRQQETWVWSLGREDLLEQERATHSSILAWKIPWTEEPDRSQSWGCKGLDTTPWVWGPQRVFWVQNQRKYIWKNRMCKGMEAGVSMMCFAQIGHYGERVRLE